MIDLTILCEAGLTIVGLFSATLALLGFVPITLALLANSFCMVAIYVLAWV